MIILYKMSLKREGCTSAVTVWIVMKRAYSMLLYIKMCRI